MHHHVGGLEARYILDFLLVCTSVHVFVCACVASTANASLEPKGKQTNQIRIMPLIYTKFGNFSIIYVFKISLVDPFYLFIFLSYIYGLCMPFFHRDDRKALRGQDRQKTSRRESNSGLGAEYAWRLLRLRLSSAPLSKKRCRPCFRLKTLGCISV